MTFREAQAEIESHSMATRLNVASGLKPFLQSIQTEHAVQELCKTLSSKEIQEKTFLRLVELSRQCIDREYENPWDTALAIYLWSISSVSYTLSVLAAEIVRQAPQCWWAQKLCKQLLSEKQTVTVSSATPFSLTPQHKDITYTSVHSVHSTQITLDSTVLIASLGLPMRIHMPTISGSASQNAVEGNNAWRQSSSAANQELAAAA
jgi:hypothetical protein